MTRRLILTTATLAAFLAAGAPLTGDPPSTRRQSAATVRRVAPADQAEPIAIGGHLLAVHPFGTARPGGDLAVGLFALPGFTAPVRLWAGRKNGWGAQPSLAEPIAGLDGVLIADIAIPAALPVGARLWIGIDRADARPAIGSVPLPVA